MDKSTAQAIHELATVGRLSEDSTAAVAGVLGLDRPQDVPEPETKNTIKGSAR